VAGHKEGLKVQIKTIEYRGYRLVIQVPSDPFGRWHANIWPPGTRAAIVRPAHTSEDDAIQDARSVVDHELDGSTPG